MTGTGIPRLAALLIVAAGGAASARPTAAIVDFGPTEGRRGAADPGEGGTGLDPARPITGVRYLAQTDAIVARPCAKFGMTLRVGADPGELVPPVVRVRVLHPQFIDDTGATSAEDSFDSAVVGGMTDVGFGFDHAWELQPGEWTISVSARGAEIATKRFHVTRPPGEAPADCAAAAS